MVEEEFRQILTQEMVGTIGPIDIREEEEEDDVEEDEEEEEMDEYADGLHSPVIFYFISGRLGNLNHLRH